MKKTLGLLLVAGSVMSASAGTLQWGSMTEDGSDFVAFQDNVPQDFTGYAYLFLLQSAEATVSWNGTSWNLNGASQLAYSPAGQFYGDGVLGESGAGTWGREGSTVSDDSIRDNYYYQVILLTAPGGNETLGGIVGLNGFWASTAPRTVSNYQFMLEASGDEQAPTSISNTSGLLAWETNGSWAAVPEPATMALFGLGGLALVIRRKMRKEA